MPEDPFQIYVARTRTGEVVDQLDAPAWTAQDAVSWADSRSLTAELPLPGVDRAGRTVRSSLRSVATAMSSCSLVLARGKQALFGGPAVSLSWDADGVSIACAGPTWLFDRRMAMNPALLAEPANANLILNLPPADRAIQLLTLAITGQRRDLPITLPALSGEEGEQVIYVGTDLRTVHEAIRDIVEADGGPDLVVQPVLSDDLSTMSWVVSVGRPHIGSVNPDAVWDFPLVAIAGEIDDSETVDRPYVPGGSSGSTDDTRLIGTVSVDRGDAPALERADRTSVSETRQPQLDALARSYGEQYRYAVEEFTVEAPTDAGPQYRTQYQFGDTARFSITGHPWLDDVEVQRRIVAGTLNPTSTKLVTVGARVTPAGI